MTTIVVGAMAAVGFVVMARVVQPLISTGSADFTTGFSVAEVGYALGFGLLVVALIEAYLYVA